MKLIYTWKKATQTHIHWEQSIIVVVRTLIKIYMSKKKAQFFFLSQS